MPGADGRARTRALAPTHDWASELSTEEREELRTMSPTVFTVAPVPYLEARAFVSTLHYSGGMSAGPKCFGLYYGEALIGVCAFATPIGETVRACVFGPEYVNHVTELHRLVLLDEAPRNSESYFITRALRALKEEKPQVWAVLSYADSSAGHLGTIYQATNALYCGTASARNQYRDSAGRLRPHRQDGVEITRKQAREWGWTVERRGVKHRYLFLTPDSRAHHKELKRRLLLQPTDYPKEPKVDKALHLDIETFSSTNLRGTGVYRYSEDPTFQILMCAWSLDGSPVEVTIGEDEIRRIPGLGDPDVVHVAHNANFERIAFQAIGIEFDLPPESWRCTQAIAAQLGYPQKLDHLARALGGEQKDSAGTRLINWFCKPDQHGRRRLPQNHPEKWAEFVEYCRQDVVTLMDVDQTMGSAWPTEREHRVWVADQRVNDRGLKVDTDLARRAARAAAHNHQLAEREVREITGLETPGNVDKLARWCGVQNLREETVTEALAGELEPDRRRVLELRQELAGSATKKFSAALAAVSTDGRLRGGFRYHGAHTGRWTGHGVQPHNLPRATLDSDAHVEAALLDLRMGVGGDADTLKALVRSLFLGPLCVVDYAAIEARVIAWLADEEWALEAFRDGRDIYVETAERMGGLTRAQGKVAVLALGYGGGIRSLRIMGAEGTDKQLQATVNQWRYANPRIVRMWRRMERAFRLGGPVGKLVRAERQGTDRLVHLPSGRALIYHGCRWVPSTFGPGDRITFDSVRFPGQRDDTWGGSLVENVVQAVARDVLADALVRLDEHGYRTVAHVHDELVVEAEASELDVISKIVTTPPDWATGLPIDGEGFACERYRKN